MAGSPKIWTRQSEETATGGPLRQTTKSIAAKLSANTGSELALAGAAHLTLAKQKGTFTRKELLKEMQGASGYYKSTYSNNLTKILKGLASSGKITETAKDSYSLEAKEKADLETKLG